MAHYRLLDRLPSAIVTADGSEKKMYEGNIAFFNKGDNFELRFFNPLQEKIGIEIIFNGNKTNDGLLVLNPGEDISLDRFINDKKKMIFDTYMIDAKNSAAIKATELNGDININFYKEKIFLEFQNYYPSRYQAPNHNTLYHGSTGTYNMTHMDGLFTNTTNTTSLSSCLCSVDETSVNVVNETKDLSETGRVEKGDTSNQNLNIVDVTFETSSFHSIKINLKPTSTFSKSHTTSTEIRNYCNQCGYRIRKRSWKFCPKCSEKLT